MPNCTELKPKQQGPLSLSDLASQINEQHAQCEAAVRSGLRHALEAGRLLTEAKSRIKHGGWLPWVAEHCGFTRQTASGYMRLAARWPQLQEANGKRVFHLPYREAIKLLAEPKPEAQDDDPAEIDWKKPDEWNGALQALQQRLEAVDLLPDNPAKVRECAAIAASARIIVNEAGRYMLDNRRAAGKLLTEIESPAEDTSALPELTPDLKFSVCGDRADFLEITPSADHPDHFYVGHYQDLDTDNSSVSYLRRPVNIRLAGGLAVVLRLLKFTPATPWHSEPAPREAPSYVTDMRKPAPAYR